MALLALYSSYLDNTSAWGILSAPAPDPFDETDPQQLPQLIWATGAQQQQQTERHGNLYGIMILWTLEQLYICFQNVILFHDIVLHNCNISVWDWSNLINL